MNDGHKSITNNQLAFVFPGQGSQSVGMINDLAESHVLVKTIFSEASDALEFDLWDLVRNGPAETLNMTEHTQPAIFTAGYCTWRVWMETSDQRPAVMAGHSLGEYTALVCCGVASFTDVVKLVRDRGKYMQQAVPEGVGAMAAVLGLDENKIDEICNNVAGDDVVAAANINSPGQIVIAGHRHAVARALDAAKAAGARRAVLLPVSVPSHCSLMHDAANKFARRLESVPFANADIPVIQNTDATMRTDAGEIKRALIKQLYQPVQWVKSIQNMQAAGITRIIECGPGKVLTGLIKRIASTIQVSPVHDPMSLTATISELT